MSTISIPKIDDPKVAASMVPTSADITVVLPSIEKPTTEKRVWSTEEGELLLDLYDANKDRFKDPSVRKIGVWAEICTEINRRFNADFTPERCHQKLRNFKNDFQKVIMLEKKDCRHFERLHRIFLQSSEKPLQSPEALKRKLSQLVGGPKTAGVGLESGSPEKRQKMLFPDFRSKKLKAESSPSIPIATLQELGPLGQHMKFTRKYSSSRKSSKPERKRHSVATNHPISMVNSSLSPLYGNSQANESKGNRQKFTSYASIPPDETMVNYPPIQPKSYTIDEGEGHERSIFEGYSSNQVNSSQSPVVAEIRRADCVPGSRANVPKEYYPQPPPVLCKIEQDEDDYSSQQNEFIVVPEVRNDIPGYRPEDQGQNVEVVNPREQEYVYVRRASLPREQVNLDSEPSASQTRIDNRLNESQVQGETVQQNGKVDGLMDDKVVPYQSQRASSTGESGAETGERDRRGLRQRQGQEVIEGQDDKDAAESGIRVSQNQVVAGMVPNDSSDATKNRIMKNAGRNSTQVSANYNNSNAVPQGSSTETINNTKAASDAYGSSFNGHESPEWGSPVQINRNTLNNRKQVRRPKNAAMSTKSSESVNRRNQGMIDLTAGPTYEREQLSRIADSIDNWRKECKTREAAQVEREKARDRRMEEMHQETLQMTKKFVQLFETFVNKIGETGDQIY